MTNIKISEKGRKFLQKGNAAVRVAAALATQKSELQSEQGVTVRIDDHTLLTVRSAGAYSADEVTR